MKICSLRLRRNRLSGLLFLASCIAAFFFTSSIAVTGAETVSDRVEFLNGDVLRGKIEGVKNSSSVEFFSELLKTNITIKQTGIYKLYLESIDPIATNVSGNSIITLATDDSFGGNFVRYDNETLVVDTWFCGRIAIPRSMLKSFVPSAGAAWSMKVLRVLMAGRFTILAFSSTSLLPAIAKGLRPRKRHSRHPGFIQTMPFTTSGRGRSASIFNSRIKQA